MTKYLLYILAGVIGVWLGTKFGRKKCANPKTGDQMRELSKIGHEKVKAEIEERKRIILEYAKEKGRITNDEAESMFCVSNSTAGKYLDELEKEGKLKQVGGRGRGVYYVAQP